MTEQQKQIKAAIHTTVKRIKEIKAIRNSPGQPGWMGTDLGCELEALKGLATLLCVARAGRARRHVVVLPRLIFLPALPGKAHRTSCEVKDQASLDTLCETQMALRFPVAVPEPVAEKAA